MSDTATRAREDIRYPQILRAVRETPWAIHSGSVEWRAIVEVLTMRAHGERFTAEEIQARIGGPSERPGPRRDGGVAVLPVAGVIIPKATLFSEVSGGTSIEGLTSDLRDALADPDVSAIVLDIDSPGGMVSLVTEFAAELRDARAQKPIVAVASPRAASAAYWIAAQATEVVVTKSGDLGSVGTFFAHEEVSQMQEKLGVKTTLIQSDVSPFKTEGNPFEPLSDEARASLQNAADEMGAVMVATSPKAGGSRSTRSSPTLVRAGCFRLQPQWRPGWLTGSTRLRRRSGGSRTASLQNRPTLPSARRRQSTKRFPTRSTTRIARSTPLSAVQRRFAP
jgi:signal peptide peptidase SppA